jgi:hypothetical protein
MTNEAFQEFIAEATEYLKARVASAQQTFRIGQFERYDYDLPTARFWWSDAGITKVEARLIVVGSISTESNSWLWGWANPHLDGVEMEDIERVKAFGEEHGIERLIEHKWPADETDGWEMTSVAARLLEAESAYRSPSRSGFLYLLLTDLRYVSHECS